MVALSTAFRAPRLNVTPLETRDHDSDKHVAKYSAITYTNTKCGLSLSLFLPPSLPRHVPWIIQHTSYFAAFLHDANAPPPPPRNTIIASTGCIVIAFNPSVEFSANALSRDEWREFLRIAIINFWTGNLSLVFISFRVVDFASKINLSNAYQNGEKFASLVSWNAWLIYVKK